MRTLLHNLYIERVIGMIFQIKHCKKCRIFTSFSKRTKYLYKIPVSILSDLVSDVHAPQQNKFQHSGTKYLNMHNIHERTILIEVM